jgi:glycerophosphoryl diester phosphodiesterase
MIREWLDLGPLSRWRERDRVRVAPPRLAHQPPSPQPRSQGGTLLAPASGRGRFCLVVAALLMASPALAFDLQGHRGTRWNFPENTLDAFAAALGIGVTTLETDTAISKDGVVVISHDSRLNKDITRGPDGQWLPETGPAIIDLTWEKLQSYDVGRINPSARYAQTFAEQKPVDGARLPKLSDLFDLVKRSGNDKVRFNIEIKTSPLKPADTLAPDMHADKLVAEIRKAGMVERSIVQSFDWRGLKRVHQIAPEFTTACLTARQRWTDNISDGQWTAGLKIEEHGGSVPRLVKAMGCKLWTPYYRELDAAQIKEAKALGLGVVAWTVNDPNDMAATIQLGVDGIITDRPDVLRKAVAEANLPLPSPTPIKP